MAKRSYDSYYKKYYQTKKGRAAKRRAQNKYRAKLGEMYGTSITKAIKLHKEKINEQT